MKRLSAVLIVGFFIFVVGACYYLWDRFANQKNPGTHEEVLFEVKQGESFLQTVRKLETMGLIQNGHVFSLYSRLKGEAGKMKVGEYALRRDMFPSEILNIINSGKSVGSIFTIPEGTSIYEISEMWEDQGFGKAADILKVMKDRTLAQSLLGEDLESFEGYLFPDSYSITKFTDAKQLVTIMAKKFLSVWDEFKGKATSSGMSRHQIVTLASIIEKETGAPEERAMISSVFHNRLKKGMLLQTDPTIIYGKAESLGKIVVNITRSDLTTPTRYNTYVIKGLPPGPIANPSREAIRAALEPAESENLYFVSKNQGTHVFSKDYESHLAAVKRFQMNAKAREGKSWRDLKKKEMSSPKL